jgi:hypothetical protein
MKTQNRETLKKIAELMACLPSDELLKPDMTLDKIAERQKCRRVQLVLAEEWRCRYIFENRCYPIEEAYDRREISKAKANLYFLIIVETEKRWGLFQAAEPLLRGFQEQLAGSPPLQEALSTSLLF